MFPEIIDMLTEHVQKFFFRLMTERITTMTVNIKHDYHSTFVFFWAWEKAGRKSTWSLRLVGDNASECIVESLTGKCSLKDAVIKYNRIGQRREQSHVSVTSSNRLFSWKLNASEAPSEALREESKFWSELLGELETVIHLFKRFFVYKTNLL